MNIEFNGDRPLFTAFHTIRQGTVFSYQGDYYIRIESILTNWNIDNAVVINCIRLSDGAIKYLDNHKQVMVIPTKLVIN